MEIIDIATGVLHDALTLIVIVPTMTSHIADHLHTGTHQPILGIRADYIPIQCTSQVREL